MRKLWILSVLTLSGCASPDYSSLSPEQRSMVLQYLLMSQANQPKIPLAKPYYVPNDPVIHCNGTIIGNNLSTSCR